MIHIRRMRDTEFPAFVEYFVPDYAAEISTNYDESLSKAEEIARRELENELSMGVDTPGHLLFCIVPSDEGKDTPVGYVWCKPDKNAETVFISEFYIYPAHRGKGYGKFSLSVIENMFRENGYREIKLRVAADNQIAQNLYTGADFIITGVNMKKRIR